MKEYIVKINDNGSQEWYLNGVLHREDGPAVIDGDHQEWYLNGKFHREDGPAIIHGEYHEWCLNGVEYSKDRFKEELNILKLNSKKRRKEEKHEYS